MSEPKKRYYPMPLRGLVVVLVTVLLWCGTACVVVGAVGASVVGEGAVEKAQADTAKQYLRPVVEELIRDYAMDGVVDEPPSLYTYIIKDKDGQVLDSTYDDGDYLTFITDEERKGKPDVGDFIVTVYCPPAASLRGDAPVEKAVRLSAAIVTHAWRNVGMGVLCLVLGGVGIGFLCCAAGRRRDGTVACRWPDRILFDVFTVLWAALLAAPWLVLHTPPTGFLLGTLLLCLSHLWYTALLLSWILSVAVRVKLHTLWTNTLLYRLWQFASKACAAAGRHVAVIWQVLGVLALVTVLEIAALLTLQVSGWVWLLWGVEKVLLVPLALWAALGLTRLQGGIRRMAQGDISHHVDTEGLGGVLRATAEDINCVGDGLQAAVEQQLKSERMKTELITNVSHDIKTPLTSIISYVDLLEKENIQDPTQREYLAVLSRQSARLKKLVDDLLEASKASTGNIAVNLEPCHLEVLLGQVMGEYSQRAQAAQVELQLHCPATPVTVLADSRHLWRALDNLMGNVCKYAQPHTRAYVDVTVEGAVACVTLRNVSREELHITAEELMERFVRGDSARHTDGSGLGLAIARSLIELQGGTLSLTVDGDLFKIRITLPTTEE